MKTHFSKFLVSSLLLAVFCGVSLFTPSAYAAPRPQVYLQVSPAKQNLGTLEPGQVYHGSFKVQNVGSGSFRYKIYATPFKISNEKYDKEFEKTDNYSQISKWFSFNKTNGELASDTEAEIKYTIKVPKDVPAGSQHMAIMASTDDGGNKGNIKAISRVGIILRTKINGKTKSCAKILQNSLPGLFFAPPVSATSRVENCGNVDATAKYSIKVSSIFGGREIYNDEKKPTVQDIYPETKYLTATTWPNAPRLGIFWVEHKIQIANEVSNVKKLVVIFPVWLVIVFALLILTIIFRFLMRRRG